MRLPGIRVTPDGPRAACAAALAVSVLLPATVISQPATPTVLVVTEAHRRELMKAVESMTTEALADVLRRARAGDADAQVVAALSLFAGNGISRDQSEAMQWLRAAVERGHPIAQNSMGMLYALGAEGLPRDAAIAVEWFRKAASHQYPQAESNLGWCYFTGDGVALDPAEAVRLFRLAADKGNASGQNRLGVAYALGKGVARDDRAALTWYRKAADGGDLNAMRNLAQAYNYGTGVPRDYTQAATWYRKAAEAGDTSAQVDLAISYIKGEGVRKDKEEAEKWFRKASEQGDAIGSFYLGQFYIEKRFLGHTDSVSVLTGRDRFDLAARQGYPVAAFKLGQLYSSLLSPHPIGKDDRQACTWYLVASHLDRPGPWEERQPGPMQEMRRELPRRIDQVRKSLGAARYAECERAASAWMSAHAADRAR